MKSSAKQFRNRRINQIETLCEKFNVEFSKHTAQTGTVYFTIADKKIRVSDHADAYATADYNCDPFDSDHYKQIKEMIQETGESFTLTKERVKTQVNLYHSKYESEKAHALLHIYDGTIDAARRHVLTIWQGCGEEVITREVNKFESTLKAVKKELGL